MSEDGGAAHEVHPGASHREGEPRRRVLRQELLRLRRGGQGQPGNDRGGGEWRRRMAAPIAARPTRRHRHRLRLKKNIPRSPLKHLEFVFTQVIRDSKVRLQLCRCNDCAKTLHFHFQKDSSTSIIGDYSMMFSY